jgi:hypothetical protein
MIGSIERRIIAQHRSDEAQARYSMSSPNDPGVSAERNAVIVASKAVNRILGVSSWERIAKF